MEKLDSLTGRGATSVILSVFEGMRRSVRVEAESRREGRGRQVTRSCEAGGHGGSSRVDVKVVNFKIVKRVFNPQMHSLFSPSSSPCKSTWLNAASSIAPLLTTIIARLSMNLLLSLHTLRPTT
jgi:hypothetical protein